MRAVRRSARPRVVRHARRRRTSRACARASRSLLPEDRLLVTAHCPAAAGRQGSADAECSVIPRPSMFIPWPAMRVPPPVFIPRPSGLPRQAMRRHRAAGVVVAGSGTCVRARDTNIRAANTMMPHPLVTQREEHEHDPDDGDVDVHVFRESHADTADHRAFADLIEAPGANGPAITIPIACCPLQGPAAPDAVWLAAPPVQPTWHPANREWPGLSPELRPELNDDAVKRPLT